MILIESDYGFDTGILRKRAVPVGWHFEKQEQQMVLKAGISQLYPGPVSR